MTTLEEPWTKDLTGVLHAKVLAREGLLHEIQTRGESHSVSRVLAEALAEMDRRLQIKDHPFVPTLCTVTLQENKP